ncbi:MAG: flagellar biosynthesis protein FlhB [Candidatus Marinimicrobia bacterium]|nr:flagellar biosynthesis protein FlhB [Candidatus Neomarinimicrobiota bacterium]
MADKPAQDRTEEATPKRLKEARDRGESAKSAELVSAALMLATMLYFYFAGGIFLNNISGTMVDFYMSVASIDITPRRMPQLARWMFQRGVIIVGPVIMVIMVTAIVVNILQVGVNFAPKALTPKFSKVNPMAGLKKIFSTKGLVELIKGVFKIIVVGMIVYTYVAGRVKDYPFLAYMTPLQILGEIGSDLFNIVTYAGIALLIMAIADYIYQRWEFRRNLRMTKQEIKDEARQTEGNPEVKSRIRSAMRDLSRNRMMRDVADATVVVTNPVHLAVALKYDENDEQAAPILVAKGQRKLAERIKKVARENNIPIKESPPLARALYASAEVGDEIPYAYYQAVAEILAEIYSQDHVAA